MYVDTARHWRERVVAAKGRIMSISFYAVRQPPPPTPHALLLFVSVCLRVSLAFPSGRSTKRKKAAAKKKNFRTHRHAGAAACYSLPLPLSSSLLPLASRICLQLHLQCLPAKRLSVSSLIWYAPANYSH